MNDDDVRKIVTANRGGPVEEIHGPYTLNSARVWQVWSKPDGEYETRFVVLKPNGATEYRDTFASLAAQIEQDHAKGRILPSIMAALGFIVGLGLLVFVVVGEKQIDGQVIALVVSLLASAGAFYYGTWKS